MQSLDKRPLLIVLVGPTAVGKTALSLQLAMRIDSEIISADSRLFYRGMDIGTAKPSSAEQAAVPHHLIDFLNPDQTFSLSEFQKAVYTAAGSILQRNRLPLMVGGTGQYVRAITEGWRIPSQAPDERLRQALMQTANQLGSAGLHRWLSTLDPTAAKIIDHRNVRRTIRALEVIFNTGQPFSVQRRAGKPRFKIIKIGLMRQRKELYKRIDDRIDLMFEQGFIAEVQSLITAGYGPELPSMSAIGYQEVCEYISGNISLEEAVIRMKRRTRAFVRRQANWFKPEDPSIRWFHPDDVTVQEIEEIVKSQFDKNNR